MRLYTTIAISIGLTFLSAAALAKGGKYEVLDEGKVYYGDCSSFEKPATISVDNIFPHIHAYKLIKERNLDEKDPEYWVLLMQANKVFRDALKQVAVSKKHDLVAECGALRAVTPEVTIPDITHLVVAEVERNPEGR